MRIRIQTVEPLWIQTRITDIFFYKYPIFSELLIIYSCLQSCMCELDFQFSRFYCKVLTQQLLLLPDKSLWLNTEKISGLFSKFYIKPCITKTGFWRLLYFQRLKVLYRRFKKKKTIFYFFKGFFSLKILAM